MQVKIFTIPVHGGEALEKELNAFLRARRILQIEQQLLQDGSGSSWTFCVRYIEGEPRSKAGQKQKVDYKQELSAEAFERFTTLRKARKTLAEEDAIPAFAILTDKEMAALSQLPQLNINTMQTVKGIGEKKTAKYGERLLVLVKW